MTDPVPINLKIRYCVRSGCDKKLSQFNLTTHCFVHQYDLNMKIDRLEENKIYKQSYQYRIKHGKTKPYTRKKGAY